MIGIEAGREAYQERKIDNMGWIKSDGNLAYGLKKLNNPDLMQHVMLTGKLTRLADEWIIRPQANNSCPVTNHDKSQSKLQLRA